MSRGSGSCDTKCCCISFQVLSPSLPQRGGLGLARLTDKNIDLKYINVHHFRQLNLLPALNPKAYNENTEMTKKKWTPTTISEYVLLLPWSYSREALWRPEWNDLTFRWPWPVSSIHFNYYCYFFFGLWLDSCRMWRRSYSKTYKEQILNPRKGKYCSFLRFKI